MSPFRSLSRFVEARRLPPAVVPVVSLSAHAVLDGRLASADCATRAFCWLLVSVLGAGAFGPEQGRDSWQALHRRALNSNGSLGRLGLLSLESQGGDQS